MCAGIANTMAPHCEQLDTLQRTWRCVLVMAAGSISSLYALLPVIRATGVANGLAGLLPPFAVHQTRYGNP